jgi:8-oxo-dGTP pyrophosphatase MutT (NUDIX family)
MFEPFPIRRTAAVLVPVYEAAAASAPEIDQPATHRSATARSEIDRRANDHAGNDQGADDRAADGQAADDRADVMVVLTRRPWGMRSHSGEVSFPGGGQDPGDVDLVDTALREAWEEIGLLPQHVEIIGRLDPLATLSSGAHITPYVGAVRTVSELVPSPHEVDAILHVPLRELLRPDVYHEERWAPLPGMEHAFPTTDGRRPMYFFDLVGDTVWGATARMLYQLLTIATGTDAARSESPG